MLSELEYGAGIPDKYDRAAVRFSARATRAEFISDPTLENSDYDSPHRLMNVSQVDDKTLAFDVTCPAQVLFAHYTRGYTASSDDLWLFQNSLVEVYKKRP